VALAAASLTACGSDAKASGTGDTAATDTSVSMPVWYSGGGNTHMATVSRDVTGVDDDAAANDTASLGADCATLLTDVQAAQVYAPAPDLVTQQHWSDALDSLAQSAADCSDGATRSDSALITKAGRERRTGSAELRLAMDSAADLGDG
jgi:hypothetical protein